MPDLKARQALPSGPELRSYPAKFEVRTLSGSQVELQGYATTYDEPYEMYDMFGPYTEVARSGMCSKTLAEGADVAYLANHEGLTLARTKTGSLRLSEDTTGLLTVATLNTARSDARDLVTAVEDGEIDQMSFAFRVMRQVWSPDFDQRDLLEVNLNRGDVSAVNYGANPLTSNADDAVDQAQPLLADLMGVENPDDEDQNSADDAERALAYLDVLRRQHEHETEASRLIVGF
jgi:HK97 family phage prohead protease